MYLFFRLNFFVGIIYSIICILRLYFLPDDRIKLPDSVEYLNDLDECKKGHWLVCLYTTWSPQCQRMAPVFSDLSREFGCEGLKFGKSKKLFNKKRFSIFFKKNSKFKAPILSRYWT